MKTKKYLFLLSMLVSFLFETISCSNPNTSTPDIEGDKNDENTLISNYSLSFDVENLKGLALTEETSLNKSVARSATENTLKKITESGNLEDFLKIPEDDSIQLYNVTQILKSPYANSTEIYILFNSQGSYRTSYKETDEWGNTWDSFKFKPIGRLLCVFENGDYLDILQPAEEEYKDPFNLTFDNNGNLFYCLTERTNNNWEGKDVIYKFDPKTRQSTKLVPALSGTRYEKFYISKNSDWLIVQGHDNSSSFLQGIPVNNTENAYNIWYSSNSWGSSDWIYDEKTKDVYFITDNKLYKSPYKNGGYDVKNNTVISELSSSNNDTYISAYDFLEYTNQYHYKLAGRGVSHDLEAGGFKDYLFINPDSEEIDYTELVDYCFAQLLYHLKSDNLYNNETYYYQNYRKDYEIRFDIFSTIPGFEKLASETKDENGYYLADEELFKAIIEKDLLPLLASAEESDRYTTNNVYNAYKNNFFADVLFLKGTNTKIEPTLFQWNQSIGFETCTSHSTGNLGFISYEYHYGPYWKRDYKTGEFVDTQKVLSKFAELCGKDKIDFSLKNYENDEDYNILYTELKNEEAILFLSESTERMDTLFNAIEGYDFLRKTCFISGTDRPIFDGVSSEYFTGSWVNNIILTDNGIFGCYDNKVVQLTDNNQNPILKYVNFNHEEKLMIIDVLINENKYYFKNSILSEQGHETGYQNIFCFDPAQQTQTLENVLWNMDGNNQYKITSYTITDNYLYGCFVKGTKVIIGKIDLTTKQYEKFSESDSDSGFKQIIMFK